MASRYSSISRPGVSLLKSTIAKSCNRPAFSVQSLRSPPSFFSRPRTQMGALQSLLPLHSAISAARLTSCLGADTIGCRSLSQGENRADTEVYYSFYCLEDDKLLSMSCLKFLNLVSACHDKRQR